MHVLCPSCETAYEIPVLDRPRKLRCAQCGGEWRVVPEPPEPPEPPPPAESLADDPPSGLAPDLPDPPQEPRDAAADGPPAPLAAGTPIATPASRPQDPSAVVTAVLWVLSLAVLAALLAGLWHWRAGIAHHWPPSLRLYRLLPGGVPDGVPSGVPGAAPSVR